MILLHDEKVVPSLRMLYTLLFICAQFINPLKNRLKQIALYNLNFDASIQKYVFDGLAIFCLTSAFGEMYIMQCNRNVSNGQKSITYR